MSLILQQSILSEFYSRIRDCFVKVKDSTLLSNAFFQLLLSVLWFWLAICVHWFRQGLHAICLQKIFASNPWKRARVVVTREPKYSEPR